MTEDRGRSLRLVILFVCLNATLWALYAVAGGSPAQHQDSLEAYAWGREFQLGYFKHPPLWAWVAGVWFELFPRDDFSFYFLSELNASLGIVGAWMLMGRFVSGPVRQAAAALLLLTTFFTFNALRFNANTFPLSIWPWTMVFFVRSIERRTAVSGLLFGLFAGFALLTKYYAAVLLATCLAAALVHRDRRAYFSSAAPYVAVLAFALTFLPHAIWLVRDGFGPIRHMIVQSEVVDAKFVDTPFGFALTCLAYHALQIAIVVGVRFWKGRAFPVSPRHGWPFLLALATGPFLLTVAIGLFGLRVRPLYAIPIFPLTPLPLVLAASVEPKSLLRVATRLYGAIVAIALVAAPIVAIVGLPRRPGSDSPPMAEVAQQVEAQFRARTGRPLRIVAGTWPYAVGTVFYAAGDVSDFTDFDFSRAPWVTPERIRHEGLAYICALEGEDRCFGPAAPWRAKAVEERELVVRRTFLGAEGAPVRLLVGIVPPEE